MEFLESIVETRCLCDSFAKLTGMKVEAYEESDWMFADFGVGYGAYFVLNALPIGTGFAARYLCTAIFEQGEDARTIFNREVAPEHPLFAMATYEIDATQRSVEARSMLGLGAMRAVHRPGFGCTLLWIRRPRRYGLRPKPTVA